MELRQFCAKHLGRFLALFLGPLLCTFVYICIKELLKGLHFVVWMKPKQQLVSVKALEGFIQHGDILTHFAHQWPANDGPLSSEAYTVTGVLDL